MKRALILAVSAAGLLLTASLSRGELATPTTYLPESHRAYDFLERMEHLYLVSGAQLGTKPLTRARAAELLYSITIMDALSITNREELNCLRSEFKLDYYGNNRLVWDDDGPIDYLPGFLKTLIYRNRRNFYTAQGDNYTLFVDPVIVRRASLGKLHDSGGDDHVYTAGNGLRIRGTVGDHLGFHIDVRDSREWGSRTYPEDTAATMPGRGFASFKGDRVEFDETRAHIAYTNGPFVLSFGSGENVWGRGKRGTLALSGFGAPYDMVRLETAFWRLKMTFFTAEIEQYPPIAKLYYNNPPGIESDSVAVQKYLSGHRLEVDLTDRVNIGLYEAVVFGGRWDMSYLNPVMFLKGAEHFNGDHDNAVMGMDFRILVHRIHSIYGEFFIDDITTTKLGTDWYGNKLAYQIGTFIITPFGIDDLDCRVEYTRVNPWVYTHRTPINRYDHYGDVLGYPAGPNSDEVFVELRKRFSRRFHTSLAFARRRHGANPPGENIGGDPLAGFSDGDSKSSKFLAGIRETTNLFSLDLSYELLWELFLKVGYSYEEIDGDSVPIYRFSLGLNE